MGADISLARMCLLLPSWPWPSRQNTYGFASFSPLVEIRLVCIKTFPPHDSFATVTLLRNLINDDRSHADLPTIYQ